MAPSPDRRPSRGGAMVVAGLLAAALPLAVFLLLPRKAEIPPPARGPFADTERDRNIGEGYSRLNRYERNASHRATAERYFVKSADALTARQTDLIARIQREFPGIDLFLPESWPKAMRDASATPDQVENFRRLCEEKFETDYQLAWTLILWAGNLEGEGRRSKNTTGNQTLNDLTMIARRTGGAVPQTLSIAKGLYFRFKAGYMAPGGEKPDKEKNRWGCYEEAWGRFEDAVRALSKDKPEGLPILMLALQHRGETCLEAADLFATSDRAVETRVAADWYKKAARDFDELLALPGVLGTDRTVQARLLRALAVIGYARSALPEGRQVEAITASAVLPFGRNQAKAATGLNRILARRVVRDGTAALALAKNKPGPAR